MSDDGDGSPFLLVLVLFALLILVLASTQAPAQETTQPLGEKKVTYTGTNICPLSAFLTGGVPNMAYPAPFDWATYEPTGGHNGSPAIHISGGGSHQGEINSIWPSLSPGDHVYFEAWVKTGAYSSSDPQAGGGFGFDFGTPDAQNIIDPDIGNVGSGGGIIGSSDTMQIGHPDTTEKAFAFAPNNNEFGYTIEGNGGLHYVTPGTICKVPYGQDWVKVQYDFIVPSTYYTHLWHNRLAGQTACHCDPVQIGYLTFWTYCHDDGDLWFSDTVMYINPSGSDETPPPMETTFNITATTDAHTTIVPSGVVAVNQGANQTFIATPATGYHLLQKTVDGVVTSF